MAALTTKHLLFYFGTNASIPSGWTRYTDADDRLLKGAAAGSDPGTTGGATTHTHTYTHDHAAGIVAHSHGVSGDSVNTTLTPSIGTALQAIVADPHPHSSANSSTTKELLDDGPFTTSAESSLPASTDVIFVRPSADTDDVPNQVACIMRGLSGPSGWNRVADATHLVGAVAAGDGGGMRGSDTHDHTLSHAHDTLSHSHGTMTSGGTATGAISDADSGGFLFQRTVMIPAHHQLTIGSGGGGLTTGSASPDLSGSTDGHLKPRHYLACLRNESGSAQPVPYGAIAAYTGTLDELAALADWKLCDGANDTPDLRARYVHCTGDATLIDTAVSPAATHTHSVAAHTHTLPSHSDHPVTDAILDSARRRPLGSGSTVAGHSTTDPHDDDHTWTVAANNGTMSSSGSGTTTATDAEYKFITVLWVQFQPQPSVRILGGRILGGRIAGA